MLLLAKFFVGLIGLMYLGLALWCSVQPDVTSKKVGLERLGGSGQSEFLTVYGGLEFGIAILLIASLFRSHTLVYGLWAILLIHVSLVIFRTISFFLYSGIESFTYRLAVAEWIIFLASAVLLFFTIKQEVN